MAMILVALGSLGFGVYAYTDAKDARDMLESANARAVAAEGHAKRQEMIASEQRNAAERAVKEARNAMMLAEQSRAQAEKALADCQKRRK